MKGIGINFTAKDFLKSLFIIFICCFMAALLGYQLINTQIYLYINLIGAILMFFLAVMAIADNKNSDGKNNFVNIYAIAFSVAADACAVCIYLGACGFNPVYIAVISAVMHCILMKAGTVLSAFIINSKTEIIAKYISASIFFIMGIFKLMT